MSKVYFYYAAMNSGKSTVLLQADYNYNERGMRTLRFSPGIDTRAGVGRIESRIGLSSSSTSFSADANLFDVVRTQLATGPLGCVLVDEAQFLSGAQVDQLTDVADDLGIPVLCYGLRTDFKGNLFPGSARLLALADKIVELKGVCHCGRKATMNLRVNADGTTVVDGPQVEIGGNARYLPMCRRHFKAALRHGTVDPAAFLREPAAFAG